MNPTLGWGGAVGWWGGGDVGKQQREFQVIFNEMQVVLCSCCYQCFLSVFVVAAVLEGVHFNFGSRPVPMLFQVLILVQSAVPVLLFFGYLTNKLRKKEKKEYPKHLDYIFNRGTSFFNCFFALVLISHFLLRWCCFSCCGGTPAA